MRRALFDLLLICCLAWASTVHAQPSTTDLNRETVTVGVSLPLTGEASNEGLDLQRLLLFANAEIAQGRFKFIFEDDRCTPRSALLVANKLVKVDKVKYLLGYSCSGAYVSAAPILEAAQVLTIGLVAGAPSLSDAGDYLFRVTPNLKQAGVLLGTHAAAHYNTVLSIAEETEYSQQLTDSFEAAYAGEGRKLLKETFIPGSTDFRTFFAKYRGEAGAVFLNPQSEEGLITQFKQLREMNWNGAVYAMFYPSFPGFSAAFGEKADGIVFADLPTPTEFLAPSELALLEKFRTRFGKLASSDFYAVLAFGAVSALFQTLNENPADPKSYLYEHTFKTPVGELSFDKNGDVQGERFRYVLKTIKGGKVLAFAD